MPLSLEVRAYHSALGRMRMLAGHPALDVANSLHWREGKLLDFVADYAALARFCAAANLLTEKEAGALQDMSEQDPATAANVLRDWLALRACLKAWADALQQDAPPTAQGLAAQALEKHLAAIMADAKLATLTSLPGDDGSPAPPALELPLLRSAVSAWALLAFPPQGRVGRCEADQCGGFFIDQSRTRPRRWCSMDGCGNRAKAARHRQAQARDN